MAKSLPFWVVTAPSGFMHVESFSRSAIEAKLKFGMHERQDPFRPWWHWSDLGYQCEPIVVMKYAGHEFQVMPTDRCRIVCFDHNSNAGEYCYVGLDEDFTMDFVTTGPSLDDCEQAITEAVINAKEMMER